MSWKLLWRLGSAQQKRGTVGNAARGESIAAVLWRFFAGLILLGNFGAFAQPLITVQPQDQTATNGGRAVFTVTASSTQPLSYQWRFNGNNIGGATSNALTLTNVSLLNNGGYSVLISSSQGSILSSEARLIVDDYLTFRMTALRTNGYIALEVNNIVGDDRGGIALSSNYVFLQGDNATGRWRKQDVGGGVNTGSYYETLITDLRTEKAYLLANGTTPTAGGVVDGLLELTDTGGLTGNRISFSTNLYLAYYSGLFAGYGRILLYDWNNSGNIYNVDLPSGKLTTLGTLYISSHTYSENWAFWGVAEYFRGDLYIVYGNNGLISRTRVRDGTTTTAASFYPSGLSDLASFTFSPSLSRWFFHYEGSGIFGSRDETLGSAKALFTTNSGFPVITQDPVSTSGYAGVSATFSALGDGTNITYQWRHNGIEISGATNATLVVSNLTPADAGAYVCAVSNPAGTALSQAAFLTVIAAPSIVSQPYGQQVNANENATFQVSADGAPPLMYQWRLNGTNIANATNSVVVVSQAQPSDAGLYSVVVSNIWGSALSMDAPLTVIATPQITADPQSQFGVFAGSYVSFYANFIGGTPLFFQWLFNGTNIVGETNSYIFFNSVQPTNEGVYSVVITNVYGSATSGPATLTIISKPVISQQPQDTTVNAGDFASFYLSAYGPGFFYYQWQFNGTNLAGQNNQNLQLSNVQTNQQGLYSAIVSNSYGAVTSVVAKLTVVALPLIVTQPREDRVVAGGTAYFDFVYGGPGPFTFQWLFNGAVISRATNASLLLTNVSLSQTGLYSVRLSNAYGSTTSTQALLTIVQPFPENAFFRILDVSAAHANIIDDYNVIGNDFGSIAVSLTRVFCSGTFNITERANLQDLANDEGFGYFYPAMASDLRMGAAYVFANEDIPMQYYTGVASNLIEVTSGGLPTGRRITLSTPIPFPPFWTWNVGFFSGYGRILVHNTTNVYSIALPSGQVSNLGAMSVPFHNEESWAFWGIAEYDRGTNNMVYAYQNNILRTRVPDGLTSAIRAFANIGNIASITASLYHQRWYFHFPGTTQFGGVNSSLGYADAAFLITPVDHYEWAPIPAVQVVNTPFNVTLLAKAADNTTLTNYNGNAIVSGNVGNTSIPLVPSVVEVDIVNGVWNGQITVPQPSTGMQLTATDDGGRSGGSGTFDVLPLNDLFVKIVDAPDPVIVSQPLLYTITVSNTGPGTATSVVLSNFLDPTVVLQNVSSSRGSCTNNNGIIRCDFGDLPGATGATVTVQVTPAAVGSVTNRVTVRRGESDSNTTNNTAIAVTEVDFPGLSINDVTIVEGNAGTNFMTFTVNLSAPATNTVTVDFTTFNGTATVGNSDYIATNGTLTFLPGVTNQSLQVRVRGDTLYETNETFNVGLNSAVNAAVIRGTGIGTILNDDPAPQVFVDDGGVVEGNSGTNNMAFRIRLSARTGLQILVGYSTSNGTAIAGSDYLPVTNVISFAANLSTTTQTVNVPILGDTLVESNETLYLNITMISNAVAGRVQATGTITNDDGIGVLDHFSFGPIGATQETYSPFPVAIAAKDYFQTTVSNFNGSANLTAFFGSGPATNFILGDIVPPNSAFGDWTLGYSFTPSRNIFVTHLRHYFGIKASIWKDDGTLLVTQTFPRADGFWSETPLATPLGLSAGQTYRIAAYTGNGNYYWPSFTPFTFADGTIDQGWEQSGDTFPQNLDGIRWFVDLRYSTGASVPLGTNTFTNGLWAGFVSITNAATNVTLAVTDTNAHSGVSTPFDVLRSALDHYEWSTIASPQVANAPFTVRINAKGADNSTLTNFSRTISFAGAPVAGGASIAVVPASVTLSNGVWEGQITVTQPSAAMYLVATDAGGLSAASGAFVVLPMNDIYVTVTNSTDSLTPGQLLSYTIFVGNTGPNTATGVVLTNFLPANVIVQAVNSAGTCFTNAGSVRCQFGDIPGGQGFTVTIQVTPMATGVLTNRAIVARSDIDADLSNNSALAISTVALPALAIGDASIVEGNSGTNVMTFAVTLSGPATNTVSVSYTTFNGVASAGGASSTSDYVSTNGTLTFAPGVTNLSIQVRVRGDTLFETNEYFNVGLNSQVNANIARGTGIGTILNDDPPPVVSIGDASLVEGNFGNSGTNSPPHNMVFQVRLSAQSGLQTIVTYETAEGTATEYYDYTAVSGTVVFNANTLTLTQTINVPIVGDTTVEPDEVFYVNITSISNAVGGKTQGIGTIINDDGIGVLSRFAFSPIVSPQNLSQPMPVTIMAKDFFGATVTNFNETVSISAVAAVSGPTNYALGNVAPAPGFNGNSCCSTFGYSFTPQRELIVTHFHHYFGTKMSLWLEDGTLLAAQALTNGWGAWNETALDAPLALAAGTRYRIGATLARDNWYFFRNDLPFTFADGTLDVSYEGFGDVFPYSSDGARWWFVDFRYGLSSPIAIAPTNSVMFTNGVWSGQIAMVEPGTNVMLEARSSGGQSGLSSPFDVGLQIVQVYRSDFDEIFVRFYGVAGQRYRLERTASVNPTDWTEASSATAMANGDMELLDSGLSARAAAFYRVVLIQP